MESNNTVLWIKRGAVWAVSLVTGFILAFLIVVGPMKTDLATFSLTYFVPLGISIGMIFVIWGDALLGTRILPD